MSVTSQFSDVYTLPRWDYLSRASCAMVDKNCLYIRNEVFHAKFCCPQEVLGVSTKPKTKKGPQDNSCL